MEYICVELPRREEYTMCLPSGAHVGFSLRPDPCVNCTTSRVATSIKKILKLPGSKPRDHANAMCWPSGCHDGLLAWPSPVVSRSRSAPSILILYICCGPER